MCIVQGMTWNSVVAGFFCPLLIIFFDNTQLDFDDGSPPEHAWSRKLSSHANRLKEFNVTFREAIRMVWGEKCSFQLSLFIEVVHLYLSSLYLQSAEILK